MMSSRFAIRAWKLADVAQHFEPEARPSWGIVEEEADESMKSAFDFPRHAER